MKLILQESVPNLGEPGDEVDVSRGYGRNYLLPKGLAVLATDANRKLVEQRKAELQAKAAAGLEASQELADKLSSVSINIKRKVSEEETLYGSVSQADVVEALAEEGFEIAKDSVKLDHHIKSLGIYEVPIQLPYGVDTSVKVWVIPEEEEE